ncbi:ATP-grasp domain-containing protein [Streptomyces sp. RS10V-4]|uniref:ATP-grasp domain-containing protein n=1 Tax=Streptomyces rhizoryzae TaxID=2932493 RepID=UPI002004D450|nr:ATP-grasp domain-containing protein [Streptomyces rhizoryzae]MCK7627379.1 ATP-grasp domain-containing protein [Streptomyces rhizoryzae]
MSKLVFVGTTGPGLQALEYAGRAGHRTVLLHSPRHDFFLTDAQRARARELADHVVELADLRDPATVLDALRAAGTDPAGIDGVLTALHFSIVPTARLARALGVPGCDPDAVLAAKDKARCRALLDAAGLPNLAHAVGRGRDEVLAAAERLGYPVIVKPATGVGKVSTALARSAADIQALFAAAEDAARTVDPEVAAELDGRFIVEEVAVGPLYSVEVASDGRTFTPLVVVRRKTGRDNPVLELGSTVPCGLPAAQEHEVGDYAVRVCRALGLGVGLFHVEVIGTAHGPRLIEVNPRVSGGAIPDLVTAATGRNLFEVLVDLHVGRPAPAAPFPPIAGASHSFLTAARDCTVRTDLPDDWFEALRPRIHSGWTSVRPGDRLRRMDGNFDTYGVVRVVAEDAGTAERTCAGLMAEVEKTLGIPLTPVADPSERTVR